MSKRKNQEDTGLPKRWRYRCGAYQYRVPPGQESLWDGKKEFRLGKTLAEAHRTFAARIQTYENAFTMSQLCDRYQNEALPEKAVATQKSNLYSLRRIRSAFGDNPAELIEPHHIYQYRDAIGRTESKKKANLDLEVLSHLFTKSIEWGVIKDHPMTGKKVTKFSLKSRDRYVQDWELEEFMSVCSEFLLGYLELKGLTGMDKGDMLSIRTSGIGVDRLTVAPRKKTKTKRSSSRERTFPYINNEGESTGIEEAINRIMSLKGRPDISTHLFCTTHGKNRGRPYIKDDGTTSGFDSIWQRTMRKALAETKLKEKFTEHDLRAKVGSDLDTDEEARDLLDHVSITTTRKTYRRKAVVMKPAKGFGGNS